MAMNFSSAALKAWMLFLPALFCVPLGRSAIHHARSLRQRDKGGSMLRLTSSSFQPQGNIPRQFTCEGQDISPELTWTNAPAGTKSFALIVHDPDAPVSGGFTHWVVYNLPASVSHIAQDAPRTEKLPGGGVQGKNDFGRIGY